MSDALPCFVCAKALKNIMDGLDNQPSDGIEFVTYGHYGTTVFDPMDGSRMILNVCDECVDRRMARTRIIPKDVARQATGED